MVAVFKKRRCLFNYVIATTSYLVLDFPSAGMLSYAFRRVDIWRSARFKIQYKIKIDNPKIIIIIIIIIIIEKEEPPWNGQWKVFNWGA